MLISRQHWSAPLAPTRLVTASAEVPTEGSAAANAALFKNHRSASGLPLGRHPSGALDRTEPTAWTTLYERLGAHEPDVKTQAEAAAALTRQLQRLEAIPAAEGDCPDTPEDLQVWMENGAQLASAKYQAYLDARKKGAPRSYFTSRSHALYVLRGLAPTKLVDGAWLYGLVRYWENPRYADLIRIYLEELGDGHADKNHVVLYRSLLARYGLDINSGLPDAFYAQGAMQLALAWNAEDFLPEILGFNLGYEQLPLHLLITAYELNELGIDPYYFTLHVTVDNAQTGHALRAVRAVRDALPRLRHDADFWKRVQLGCRLSGDGVGTIDVIRSFDIEQEVMRLFAGKSEAGQGVHSDYCRIEGRTVNDWLSDAADVPAFMAALVNKGWIRLGEPAENSRFWNLLQGPTAEMFGVFSPYELQLIHDWIRGEASSDGAAYTVAPAAGAPGGTTSKRPMSFKAQKAMAERRAAPRAPAANSDGEASALLDPDLTLLNEVLPQLDAREQTGLLVKAMSPAEHWTPAGLHATRLFSARL
jgi:hypothetical protein